MAPEERRAQDEKIFVSFHPNNADWAEWVVWYLKNAGIAAVSGACRIGSAGEFAAHVAEAFKIAPRVLVVLTPDYVSMGLTTRVWSKAFAADPLAQKGTVIALKVWPTDLSKLSKKLNVVDVAGLEEPEAIKLLVATVGAQRQTETAPVADEPIQFIDEEYVPVEPEAKNEPEPKKQTKESVPAEAVPEVKKVRKRTWYVPIAKNRSFSGRRSILRELDTWPTPEDKRRHPLIVQAITGMPGVGKSQIAAEYAYRHERQYKIIWWLRAERKENLREDFRLLAENFGVAQSGVLDWLDEQYKWLLIYDGAPDAETIREFLPRKHGHILITSANAHWSDLGSCQSVGPFERSESHHFLREKLPGAPENSLEVVARTLGDLPAALAQAAAFMQANHLSGEDYATQFETRRSALWKEEKATCGYDAYQRKLGDAVLALRKKSPEGFRVLALQSFLSADFFPKRNLREGGNLGDSLAFGSAIQNVMAYSLLEEKDEAFRAHPIVQRMVKELLSAGESAELLARAVSMLNSALNLKIGSEENWRFCESLLSHAQSVCRAAEKTDMDPVGVGRLLNEMSIFYLENDELQKAKIELMRAEIVFEKAGLSGDVQASPCLMNLGRVFERGGDLVKAQNYFEKALQIRVSALGDGHAAVAAAHSALGKLWLQTAEFDRAKAELEKALDIYGKLGGSESTASADVMLDLSAVLRALDNVEAADHYLGWAEDIVLKNRGLDCADVWLHLGSTLRNLERFDSAELALMRAKNEYESVYGSDHPILLDILREQNLLYYDQGSAKQCDVLEQLLGVLVRKEGAESTEVIRLHMELEEAFRQTENFEQAESHLDYALNLAQKGLARSHPIIGNIYVEMNRLATARLEAEKAADALAKAETIAQTLPTTEPTESGDFLLNLGMVFEQNGDAAKSAQYLEGACANFELTQSENRRDLADSLFLLAQAYRALSTGEKSIRALAKALPQFESVYGPRSAQTALVMDELGRLLLDRGDFDRAESLVRQAGQYRLKLFGPKHRKTLNSLYNLATVCRATGKYTQAINYFLHCAKEYSELEGDNSAFVAACQNNLGTVYMRLGRWQEAHDHIEPALNLYYGLFGDESVQSARTLVNLAITLERQGHDDDAQHCIEKAHGIFLGQLGPRHADTVFVEKLSSRWAATAATRASS